MSLPALTPDEFQGAVEAWSQVVAGEIPLDDLHKSYVRAMRDKQDGYALTANDLVRSYRAECESERVTPRQHHNLLSGEQCSKCLGTGMETYMEHGYSVARRCDHMLEK